MIFPVHIKYFQPYRDWNHSNLNRFRSNSCCYRYAVVDSPIWPSIVPAVDCTAIAVVLLEPVYPA